MADSSGTEEHPNPPRTEEISVAGSSRGNAIFAGVTLALVLIALVAGLSLFWVVIAGALALWGTIALIRGAAENLRWEPLVIDFEQTRLALGSTTTVRIQRRSRRVIPDSVETPLEVTLKCVETYTTSSADHHVQESKIVLEQTFPVTGRIQANTFVGEFELEIPIDRGAPSLSMWDHYVKWMLEIELSPISTVARKQSVDLWVAGILDDRFAHLVDAPHPPPISSPPAPRDPSQGFRIEDPLLSYELSSYTAEVEDSFYLRLSRAPTGGITEEPFEVVRGMRVHLEAWTEGSGNHDTVEGPDIIVPVDADGMVDDDIEVPVPDGMAVSYDGDFFQVKHRLVITTDRKSATDHRVKIPVLVVPEGGMAVYRGAHPLTPG